MSMQDSPSLDNFENGLPDELPKDKVSPKKLILRISIGVLSALFVILTIINLIQTDTVSTLSGKGIVMGIVLDEDGLPAEADIYIIGTELEAKTDVNGAFKLENVPGGFQSVAVFIGDGGVEYPVTVVAGSAVDIGQVQIETTPAPGD